MIWQAMKHLFHFMQGVFSLNEKRVGCVTLSTLIYLIQNGGVNCLFDGLEISVFLGLGLQARHLFKTLGFVAKVDVVR